MIKSGRRIRFFFVASVLLVSLIVLSVPYGSAYLDRFPPFPPWRPVPYPSPSFHEIPIVEGKVRYGAFEFEVIKKPQTFEEAIEKFMSLDPDSAEELPDESLEFPRVRIYHDGKLIYHFNQENTYAVIEPIRIADLDGNGYPDLILAGEPEEVGSKVYQAGGEGEEPDQQASEESEGGEKNEEEDEDEILAAEAAKVLAEYQTDVSIFLQTSSGVFSKISYSALFFSPKDFIDVNGGGKFELLILSVARLPCNDRLTRTFLVYNLYAFEGPQLVISNHLLDRFPKFVWYTRKPTATADELLTFWDKDRYVGTLPRFFRGSQMKETVFSESV